MKTQKPSNKMFRFYEKRTADHIKRVQECIKRILQYFPSDFKNGELLQRAEYHDKSKYSPKELVPYVWLTEAYRVGIDKFKYPEGVEQEVRKATKHHITANRHHPEYFDSPSEMTDEDIVEMVADWAAMSIELGTSLTKWVKENINKKWKFTSDQTKLIWRIVNFMATETRYGKVHLTVSAKNNLFKLRWENP